MCRDEVPRAGNVRGQQKRGRGEARDLERKDQDFPGGDSSASVLGSVEAKVTSSPSASPFGRYETRNSLSGPYLTSVMGKEAGEREFWQLLQAPDTPLLEGESGGPPSLDIAPLWPCCLEASLAHFGFPLSLSGPPPQKITDVRSGF